jgi:hypothetical protein
MPASYTYLLALKTGHRKLNVYRDLLAPRQKQAIERTLLKQVYDTICCD